MAKLGSTERFEAGSFGSRNGYDTPMEKFRPGSLVPLASAPTTSGLWTARRRATAATPFLGRRPLTRDCRSGHQTFRTTSSNPRREGVELRWPLLPSRIRTRCCTRRVDPALPLSFCRRHGALVGGAVQFHDTLIPSARGRLREPRHYKTGCSTGRGPEVTTAPRLRKDDVTLRPQLPRTPAPMSS